MRAENELQNFSTITIIAQYSHRMYIKNVIKPNFRAYSMRQNDVSFVKIDSRRMKLRQLTCFRCIEKIVFESINQSNQSIKSINQINQSNQFAIDV